MKKWLAKLDDPSLDVYERRYRLLSAVSIIVFLLWLIVAFTVDGYSTRILFFGICDILFVPIMLITLKTGKIQVGAGLSGFALVFLLLPCAFFFNGGISAGAPNWCIITLVFITLTVKGGLRTFLLTSDIIITIVCYVLSSMHPEIVDYNTKASAYVDSLCSLIITGMLIIIMFTFQLHMANQERETLEKQQEEIINLSRAQNRFFSSMSHEIRTPVNTIIGLNEMILREDVSDEVAEDAGQVRAAGRMLLHLINDILDMSKMESGQMKLASAVYSTADLFSEIAGMMWIHAKEKGLAFHVDIDPALPARLQGDEIRVMQILVNVIGNAVKYTEKGSVLLSVRWQKEYGHEGKVVIQVSDTGRGIKKEDIPYLFTAFKRVETDENRRIEGTGLGLTIVKQLLDRMNGTISVNSVYRKGSTFTIEIPQGDVGAEPIGRVDMETKHFMNLRSKYIQHFEAPEARVLVVDDNAPNRMVVTKLLRDTRIMTDTAASGKEALEKTLQNRYHLIFMDHLMPGMDGITCLSMIRMQPGGLSKEAKAVALTANVNSDSRQYYMQAGFDGYLAKPCEGEELEKECIRLLPAELVRMTAEDNGIIESSTSWMSSMQRKEDIVITTDSIADIPESLIRKYHIGIIPHSVQTAEGCFQDGEGIESDGLLDYVNKGKPARMLAPDVEEYEAFFAAQLSKGNNVLHISVSSKAAGGGYANAVEAAGAFHNVTVIDSGQLSCGEGILVIEACRLLHENLSLNQIVEKVYEAKKGIRASLIVDSTTRLERSGLVRPLTARLADAFMICPVLVLDDGKIKIDRIHFGSKEAARRRYLNSELKTMDHLDCEALFVSYVGLKQDELESVRRELEKRHSFDELYFQKASPLLAVYFGDGTIGFMYQEKKG